MIFAEEFRGIPHPPRHQVEHSAANPLGDILGDEADAKPLLPDNFTPVREELAAHEPEQGRFPRAVSAHQAETVPGLQLQIHSVQERRPAECHAYFAKCQKRQENSLSV